MVGTPFRIALASVCLAVLVSVSCNRDPASPFGRATGAVPSRLADSPTHIAMTEIVGLVSASSISNGGTVVGLADATDSREAAVWRNGFTTRLACNPGAVTAPVCALGGVINRRGEIGGSARGDLCCWSAVRWEGVYDAPPTDVLGPVLPTGVRNVEAFLFDMNDWGNIVGRFDDGGTVRELHRFAVIGDQLLDFTTLTPYMFATTISNANWVFGGCGPYSFDGPGLYPCVYQDGRFVDLSPYDLPTSNRAMNDQGDVLLTTPCADPTACVRLVDWVRGDFRTLGYLPAGAEPLALNNRREIVGVLTLPTGAHRAFTRHRGATPARPDAQGRFLQSRDAVWTSEGLIEVPDGTVMPGAQRAFLWSAGELTMLPVNVPGAVNSSAIDINDRGQVLGYYEAADGSRHNVIWTLPAAANAAEAEP